MNMIQLHCIRMDYHFWAKLKQNKPRLVQCYNDSKKCLKVTNLITENCNNGVEEKMVD